MGPGKYDVPGALGPQPLSKYPTAPKVRFILQREPPDALQQAYELSQDRQQPSALRPIPVPPRDRFSDPVSMLRR